MLLLCTDLHLDDQRANEYRWNVFPEIARACRSRSISRVYCLGDMVDKRDRHSADMVNRLVSCWTSLPVAERVILRGNHDTTVSGPAFWEFLSKVPGIEYVSQPTLRADLLLLPFSSNPRVEWDGLIVRDVRAVFVHATRSGTIAENGFALSGHDLPPIPRRVKVYSGDVHNQQTVDNWIYVGASHPVKFGDNYPCRFLLLDERTYDVVEEVAVATIAKRVVEVATLDDLASARVLVGDQVKVRISTAPGSIDWGALESAVDRWAHERGVEVASIEGSYDLPVQSGQASGELSPEDLLRVFASEEEVSGDLLDEGMGLLREARG